MTHPDLSQAFISHYRTLLSYVRRKFPTSDIAEDIVQDAYLRVSNLDPDIPVLKPLALFYRVAGNLTTDYLRESATRKRYFHSGEMTDELIDDRPDHDICLDSEKRLLRMVAIMEELPVRCLEVFQLRKIDNLSSQVIADRLGISQNMVQKHLRHALLHCHNRMLETEKN